MKMSSVTKPAVATQNVQNIIKSGQKLMVVKKAYKNKPIASAKVDEVKKMHIEPRAPPSYLETRFENDIKTLISRTDRLESLMERLLEANLANNELIGDMFKDLKMFMITKRVQNSTQIHEKQVRQMVEEHVPPKKRSLSHDYETEEDIEPPTKRFFKKESDKIIEPHMESYKDCIPVEIVEEPEDYYDASSPELEKEEDTVYIEANSDDQQLPQKSFHLPLKTIEELLLFDEELKTCEEFQKNMKEVIETNNVDNFDLHFLLSSIIDKKLIQKVGSQNSNSRFLIRKTYLCEYYLYNTFVEPHLSKKDYVTELDKILTIKPLTPDPDGINLPIDNESDLKELDNRLQNPGDRKKFLNKLTGISAVGNLKGKPLIVNLLSKVLTVNMLMLHNWEGKHGKKKLSEYENVFNDCLRIVAGVTEDEFDGLVKKSLRTLQNREHIHMSRVKKRLTATFLE